MNTAGSPVLIGGALPLCEKCCDLELLRRKLFSRPGVSVPALDGWSVG
jgi:hypothetical protein